MLSEVDVGYAELLLLLVGGLFKFDTMVTSSLNVFLSMGLHMTGTIACCCQAFRVPISCLMS